MANNKNLWVGSLGLCCVAISICIVYQVGKPVDTQMPELSVYSSSSPVKQSGLVKEVGARPATRADAKLLPGQSMKSMVETTRAIMNPPAKRLDRPKLTLKARYAKSPEQEKELSAFIQNKRLVDFREHKDRKLKASVADPVANFVAEEDCRQRYAKELRPRERCGYRINTVVSKVEDGNEIVYAEVDPKASKRMSLSCRNFAQCMAQVALGRKVETEKSGRVAVAVNGAISRDYDRNCDGVKLDQMISVFESDIHDELEPGEVKGESGRDLEFWISQEKKTAEFYRMIKASCE